jgi:hypothetical protein
LVQNLNAQCETLIKELMAVREELARVKGGMVVNGNTPKPTVSADENKSTLAAGVSSTNASKSGPSLNEKRVLDSPLTIGDMMSCTKRQRTESLRPSPSKDAIPTLVEQVLSDEAIVQRIASFLDPTASRC